MLHICQKTWQTTRWSFTNHRLQSVHDLHDFNGKWCQGTDFQKQEFKKKVAVCVIFAVYVQKSLQKKEKTTVTLFVSQCHLVAPTVIFLFHFPTLTPLQGRALYAPTGRHLENIMEFDMAGQKQYKYASFFVRMLWLVINCHADAFFYFQHSTSVGSGCCWTDILLSESAIMPSNWNGEMQFFAP